MKFRLLTNEELTVLEDDLKAFLIVNGIDGAEWERVNKSAPENAVKLVELFSDVVLEKAYRKIHFLEFRSQKTCIVFHLKASETDFITLQLSEKSGADLSTPESIHEALIHHANDIQYSHNTRPHVKTHEEEVHQLLEQGCVPSIEDFWVSLEKVIEQNQV
jgi:hypothetical protein